MNIITNSSSDVVITDWRDPLTFLGWYTCAIVDVRTVSLIRSFVFICAIVGINTAKISSTFV